MIIKTSELIGPALDWAVAKAAGQPVRWDGRRKVLLIPGIPGMTWHPAYRWSQGGEIIERENINLIWSEGYPVKATIYRGGHVWIDSFGETPLIAAARCYVSFMLGDEINIPEVLK
jgi:hypothetical protein